MKYATIERIESLSEISGSDNILLARVLGWDVVVKKYSNLETKALQFQEGDFCVYIPIDTVVDISKPWFKFLGHNRNIKTRQIRGVFSQGLVLPLSDFPRNGVLDNIVLEEGFDVSELLCVTKYEKDILPNSKPGKSVTSFNGVTFPGFPLHVLAKTDEDNLRTKNKALKELIGKEISVTQKQDGSSMTCIWKVNPQPDGTKKYEFELAKRNISIWKVVNGVTVHEIDDKMVDYAKREDLISLFSRNIALQGEFCGPKIGGNRLDLNDYHWFVFNVKDLDTGRYFGKDEIDDLCEEKWLESVPEVHRMIVTEDTTIQYFQNLANEIKYLNSKREHVEGEGIVIRPVIPFYSSVLSKSFSVKVINQKYKD